MKVRFKAERILINFCLYHHIVVLVAIFVLFLGASPSSSSTHLEALQLSPLSSSAAAAATDEYDLFQESAQLNELRFDATPSPLDGGDASTVSKSGCCEDVMVIDSSLHPEGYLKAPPLYDEMNEPKNGNKLIECVYKFYGKEGERIQLFYEDFDLYYPYDIYKFNKIDCRYSDSICLKFYENSEKSSDATKESTSSGTKSLKKPPPSNQLQPSSGGSSQLASPSLNNMESAQNYDVCNCINVSYTPRQIMSAGGFIQVRFRTVKRAFDSSSAEGLTHSRKLFRGYLIRYKFTRDFGLDVKESGELENSGDCKLSFYSSNRRSGYFSSPNYPGLYPRDIECHYYFMGQENEKVQITFHTFDVEGVDQCRADTKSDYVELSNFQNRDRFYSRFCGFNKPGSIISDGRFFHVTFYSNNVFDAKGFQASYYFVSNAKVGHRKSASATIERNVASAVVVNGNGNALRNKSGHLFCNFVYLVFLDFCCLHFSRLRAFI